VTSPEEAPGDGTASDETASDARPASDELPDLRYGGALKGQATVRLALIAIGLVFFIGVAVGYLLGHGA
jgi:hypothetical protein